jgi:hypothetical protein
MLRSFFSSWRLLPALALVSACFVDEPSDTGVACEATGTAVGADASTWPAGLEDAVVAFEGLAGVWTASLDCPDASAKSVALKLEPGSHAEIVLVAPTGDDGQSCYDLGQGSATLTLDGFAANPVFGPVAAAYTREAETMLTGTIGTVGLELRSFDGSPRWASFWDTTQTTKRGVERECTTESWTRADTSCVADFDHCSCDPLCLTQAEYDAGGAGDCELGCLGKIDWSCVVESGACAIAP